MNLFSTVAFLEALGEAWFPGKWRVEKRVVAGRVLRLLVVGRGRVIHDLPYYDFPQPLDEPPTPDLVALRWFPRTVIRAEPATRTALARGLQPAPYVDWARFSSREDFLLHVEGRGGRAADVRRKRRLIERELGPLRFDFDDPQPVTLERCLDWKSAQYRATGVHDLLADDRNRRLFSLLRERGALVVNALYAGDRLLAAHAGGHHDRRLAWWVPSYDPSLGRYSPGRVLLDDLLRESQSRGDLEFDFLLGDEGYKYEFATHQRIIGPLGVTPLRVRALQRGRQLAHRVLDPHPGLLSLARRLRDHLRR